MIMRQEENKPQGGLKIWLEDVVSVPHEYIGGPYGGFVILPLGLRMNRDIASASAGQALEFTGGERARLISASIVRCNDPVTSGLAMVRYGLSTKELRDKWRRDAIYSGAGMRAIDSDECLIVCYKRKEGI